MQALATKLCQELMKEKYAIGAFLFGSMASGDIHEESDIDLALIYNTIAADIRVGKEEIKGHDFRIEVWRYPIMPFINTFEDEKLRDKPDSWMWTSLWVEMMQKGIILADPTRRLADWREKAKQWKWHGSEIKPALKQAKDNLDAVQRHLTEPLSLSSLICLREALICLSAAHVMKHGLIPSFRPKDLSQKLILIKDKEKNLLDVFELANDAGNLDYNTVEALMIRLREFIDSEWGAKRLGPRSELENAKICLNKRNLVGAMLSLRYSAYWLGFHIVNKRDNKIPAEICNGENHVKMMNQLKQASESFYEFYKQLNFADKWSTKQVEDAVSQTQKVLDDWSK